VAPKADVKTYTTGELQKLGTVPYNGSQTRTGLLLILAGIFLALLGHAARYVVAEE